jgi:hypothetical protein
MRRYLGRPRHRLESQSLVEFALAMPLLFVVVLMTINFSLIFITYYSQTQIAREAARYLAIKSVSLQDAGFATYVQDHMLPGLVKTPLTGPTTVAGDTVYQVGRMELSFTPCMAASDVYAGTCTHINRAPGETLHVQLKYDAPWLFFLSQPNFRLGSLAVHLPTQLPAYKVSVMVE